MITTETPESTNQERVKQYLIEHGYRADMPLPPEPSLAKTLGISRASLREAISGLQSQGILSARHGRGTFVSKYNFDSLVRSLTFHIKLDRVSNPAAVSDELAELVEMRELIESALVAELIDEYVRADILALYAIADQMMVKAERGEEYMQLDWRFHTALYRRSGNSMLLKLLDSFWLICHEVRIPSPSREMLVEVARLHRNVVDAIAARDAKAASAAMRAHFIGLHVPLGDPPAST